MTTDEELLRIARDVAACAAAWEKGVRLIGNVTAAELLVLANRLPELMAAHKDALCELAAAERRGRRQELDAVTMYVLRKSSALRILSRSVKHQGRREALDELASELERGEHRKS